MTGPDMGGEYFHWIYSLVCDERYASKTYWELLAYLHSVEFTWKLPMDENRADDGRDLRYRFGYVAGYSSREVARNLDVSPCSVLEMMVALAIRCEEAIMSDPEQGDRTGQWFWEMVVNLGLGYMDDSRFDIDRASSVVGRLLSRTYRKDGGGGLFRIEGARDDMRKIEIWYQMCAYLETKEGR